jgi:hypothetical protein
VPQVVPKCSRAAFTQNKKVYTQEVFLGLWVYNATSPHDPQKTSKNWKNELVPACDSEAIFLRQAQFLKAAAMGVVLAVSFFFGNARPTQPRALRFP